MADTEGRNAKRYVLARASVRRPVPRGMTNWVRNLLQRKAAVVLRNVGTADDVAVRDAMRLCEHEVVREHAACALDALSSSTPVAESVE